MLSSHIHRSLTAIALALILLMLSVPTALAYAPEQPADLHDSDLTAASAILIDAHTGRVLYSKDPDTRRYPASTTKIVTLYLALSSISNLDETITIPQEANQYPDGSSLVGLYTGEEMTWRTLLNTFFICSGNDAGIAIAVLLDGSEAAFVARMNEFAQGLGCKSTHFSNPHGFHDPEHYTTARDLAAIAREAMKNEEFRKIASTTHYTIPANNKRDKEVTKWTKNQFIARNDPSMQHKYAYGNGIKTGYTSKAGSTFVGSASRDGVDLISVVLLSTTEGKWIDSIRLMEYGFATYKAYNPLELYARSPLSVKAEGSDPADPNGGVINLSISTDYTEPICATNDEIGLIESGFQNMLAMHYSRSLVPPINAGEVMGTLTYTAPSGEQYCYTMTAENSVKAAPASLPPTIDEAVAPEAPREGGRPFNSMLWIVPLLVVMLALILMIILNTVRERRRRSRRVRGYGDYDPLNRRK